MQERQETGVWCLGAGRPPAKGNSSPLQYSYLGNPTDRGSNRLQSTGSQKSRTWLEHAHTLPFFFSFYHSTTTFTHFYFIPGNATTSKKSFLIIGRKLTSFFCIFKEYMFLFIFTKCYHILIVFLSWAWNCLSLQMDAPPRPTCLPFLMESGQRKGSKRIGG